MKKPIDLFFLSFLCLVGVFSINIFLYGGVNVNFSNQGAAVAVAANHLPVGSINPDTLINPSSYGWAVDPDVPTQSINIALYMDVTHSTAGAVRQWTLHHEWAQENLPSHPSRHYRCYACRSPAIPMPTPRSKPWRNLRRGKEKEKHPPN